MTRPPIELLVLDGQGVVFSAPFASFLDGDRVIPSRGRCTAACPTSGS